MVLEWSRIWFCQRRTGRYQKAQLENELKNIWYLMLSDFAGVRPGLKRYLLSPMPEDWTRLPVHPSYQAHRKYDCYAVYKKNSGGDVVQDGFVCPNNEQMLLKFEAVRTPKETSFSMKYKLLMEKIKAEEEAAEKDDEMQNVADSAANREPVQGVSGAEPSAMPAGADTADEPTQQIKAAAGESRNTQELLELSVKGREPNTDYPLPEEIMEGESLLPEGWMEEFMPTSDSRIDSMGMLNYLWLNPETTPALRPKILTHRATLIKPAAVSLTVRSFLHELRTSGPGGAADIRAPAAKRLVVLESVAGGY
ncbi:hypothetical protein EYF80_027799 [Liparis tanakae]|uniref:Uncharacterized protein n=1 Tax=Liparis tanakae TaxID=230148 RepID=A0A4Z2HAP9_9TELE|nr:hypothetical protein EYF80_027799 [Liparis tanakae]